MQIANLQITMNRGHHPETLALLHQSPLKNFNHSLKSFILLSQKYEAF